MTTTLAGAMPALAQDDGSAAKQAGADPCAADRAAELAKKLSNPVANLISVPIQYKYDEYDGANDGGTVDRLLLQPVVPISLSKDWNLITRTIVPILHQSGFPLEAIKQVRPRRHRRQPVPLAEIGGGRRFDLGGGAGRIAADGHRRCARQWR